MSRFPLMCFVMALASLFLFACTADDGKPLPNFDFNYIEPVSVNVANVEALNHYGSAKHTADVGHLFVVQPDETFRKYLQSRYKPVGPRGNLVLEIQEASVFEFDEDADSKIVNWMGVGGFQEYNLTLKVLARALDIPGFNEKSKVITAQRRVKMSEHASVAERERLQFEALEKAMHDIDTALQRSIRQEFGL
jgi:hypothetical protein